MAISGSELRRIPKRRSSQNSLNAKFVELRHYELLRILIPRTPVNTAMVKSVDPDVFMEQAASDYVLAVRVLHAKCGMLVQSL
jgi:hypothetical protein